VQHIYVYNMLLQLFIINRSGGLVYNKVRLWKYSYK